MNGLETGLGLAAAIWLIAFAVRSDRRARILAPLLAGLAPFIRPELAALAAVLSALRWRDLIREARVAGSQRPSNMIVRDAAMIVAAAAPWMIWYTVATGLPFPTTASVKAVWFAESCTGLGQHVHLFRLALGQFLAVAGPVSLAVFVLAFHPVGRACLVFVVAMLASYFVELPGGLTHNEGRYAHLLIPMFAAGVAIMLVPGAPTKLRNPSRVVLLFSVLFTCAMVPLQIRSFATNRLQNREYNETARFLLRSLPPDARILAHDVGYISAATPFRIIDLVGLKWPESARAHRAVTLPSCGRSRGDVIDAIARREHATHLVALRQWDELFGISAALVRHGWTMRVLRSRQDGYDVYALTPP